MLVLSNIGKKILVIHTAFPGDIILLTPLLKAISALLEPEQFTVLTTPIGKEILENFSFISSFIIYDKNLSEKGLRGFIKKLVTIKSNKFDLAIIPHRSLRSALLALFSGIKERIGFIEHKNLFISFLYTKRIKRMKKLHEVEKNMLLISSLLYKPLEHNDINAYPVEIPTSSEDELSTIKLLDSKINLDNTVLIAPCSNWATKMWPDEYFVELIRLLKKENYNIILIGSNSMHDLEICKNITESLNNLQIVNLAGKTTLRNLSVLCLKSSFMISNDSAPMHIAAAHRVPLIAIFGSTTKDLGYFPYSGNSIVVEKNIYCRPCGLHGKVKCPETHFKCMLEVSPQEVFSIFKKMLPAKTQV